jgi:cysteinyl-tRNA synthetase
MSLKVSNTLTGKKEIFNSVNPKEVKIYTCGPTVYGPLHLGHARTAIAYDIIIRYLEMYKEKKVFHIQNITDVGHIVGDVDEGEDKLVKAAAEKKMHPMELADIYIKDMWDGFDALKIRRPNISPRATGHIVEMQDWCKVLLEKEYAYEIDGDIYFDVSKFKDYGKLSGNTKDKLLAGARIEKNPKKRNPADFALWKKAAPNHIMQWTSPWGKGYPGWHIECSVMSVKYLGVPFDIHGGARELSFPHHENEIAQSTAYTGKAPVKYWVHTGLLSIEGRKMAKSLGNFVTVKDALKKYSPEQIRWFIGSYQYRSEVDFSEENVSSAINGLERINNFIFSLQNQKPAKGSKNIHKILNAFEKGFESSMDDDFNTPKAISEIYTLVSNANKELNELSKAQKNEILDLLKKVDSIFLSFKWDHQASEDLSNIEELIEGRNKARKAKDWASADKIRKDLAEKGIELFDQPDGTTTWKKK